MDSENTKPNINDALTFYTSGNYTSAEDICNALLKNSHHKFDAISLLGCISLQQKRPQKAIDYFSQAIELNSRDHRVYNNLALALVQLDQTHQAIINYEKAIELNPNYYQAYNNLGMAFEILERSENAIINYKKAVQINPNYFRAHYNLGIILHQEKELDEAIVHYKKAIQLDPNNYEVYNNLASVFQDQNRDEDAKYHYEKAIELNPNYYQAYNNLGVIFQKLNQPSEAEDNYKKSIQLNPEFFEAYKNLGFTQLFNFDFENGWTNYQYRLQTSSHKNFYMPITEKPVYSNQDLKGKILYLYSEQGHGDAIMATRFINHFANADTSIILYVPENLQKLFEINFPNIVVIDKPYNESFDYHLSIMHIPVVLHINNKNMPLTNGYLSVDDNDIKQYKDKLFQSDKQKIGIVWRGNPEHQNDKNRSFDLKTFLTKIDRKENQQYYSLQVDISEDEKNLLVENNIIDLGHHFTNFYDTAIAISCLDALISIDTSVAHLGGALNISTYIVLPKVGIDWRWGAQGESSYWYNSVRLIRDGKTVNL
ncbi:tetratricopeptide repeat protein [Thiotrichales bacterium 19S11-10]|nr:tetratricopeptide repeat protein [Thiotrichales bacterium 19S11-10]